MQSRYTITSVACLMLLTSVPAMADDGNPLERFTLSMLAVYTSAEMCKDVPNLHSKNLATRMKSYLRSYFQEDVPYWALPAVNSTISNRESCIHFIQQSIVRYQKDRRQYAENYPNNPTPPTLDYPL